MDSHLKNPDVTADPAPIDWLEYYTDDSRKCEFFHEERSAGPRGLAYAVVLRALEDGVNEAWLRLLCKFYEVSLPEKMLVRVPERRLRVNLHTMQIAGVRHRKLVLSWFDAIRISERHLTQVAC